VHQLLDAARATAMKKGLDIKLELAPAIEQLQVSGDPSA
jgi:hypothetical protein